MARRRKRSIWISLNQYTVGLPFVIVGFFYFFALSLAQGSPVFKILLDNASVVFGRQGVDLFFGVCLLVGIYVMFKPYLLRTVLKQMLVLFVLISAVLNFPIVDGMGKNYQQFGGYLSRPYLWAVDYLFGGGTVAMKVFTMILLVLLLVRFVYSFNLKLPSLKFDLPAPTKKSGKQSDKDLKKKIQSAQDEEEEEEVYEEEEEEEKTPARVSNKTSGGSLLKDLIKAKISWKIQEKTIQQKPLIFSHDKPTFDVTLLEAGSSAVAGIDEHFLMEKAKALQNKLMEFQIPVHIEGFDIGPTVVQMKVKPEKGIKLSSIESLKSDITLGVKGKSLRIIAPIPGTDLVGVEIQNPKPQMVRLREVLASKDFIQHMEKGFTNLTLGKAVDGKIVIKALEDMPHLLVAGATNSGKSVGINDFILSLMYQNSPSELKFLMVDPKQVELGMYEWIPYLLCPIITKPEVALKWLKRAVNEMERRYEIMKGAKVKNLKEYNNKFDDAPMHRIVIVIDEMADLMMSSGTRKDVETCVTRIAQKARAVGMHLIAATQRPSVNVITWLIKANIPTRIAFGVVSQVDSRTILDMKGAEDLVWRGDMLYIDPSTKFPIRIQAPYVATEEIEKVVEEIKEKYMKGLSEQDIYNAELVALLEGKSGSWGSGMGDFGDGDDDALVEDAIQLISETGKASATMLQRKLGVGFARAARIMDMLEERGVVGPQEGAKPREVLI